MELKIHGKQMDVGDALRTHIKDKLEDLDSKYLQHTIDSTVTLSPAPHNFFKTQILMKGGKDIVLQSSAVEADAYASFDSASDKIAKQLRRYKTRLRDHHERLEVEPGQDFKVLDYVLKEDPKEEGLNDDVPHGDDPVIIAETARSLQKMSVSDAVMRMDLSGESVMIFRNSKNDHINIVYRRSDGNVGWVDSADAQVIAAE